jgi:hypothetical protein
VSYEDPKGFFREPSSRQAGESCLRECESAKETLRVSDDELFEQEIEMTRNISVVLYAVVMIAVVVSVDLLFFKNRFWERLTVNIGIILVFAAFYFRFLKNP